MSRCIPLVSHRHVFVYLFLDQSTRDTGDTLETVGEEKERTVPHPGLEGGVAPLRRERTVLDWASPPRRVEATVTRGSADERLGVGIVGGEPESSQSGGSQSQSQHKHRGIFIKMVQF